MEAAVLQNWIVPAYHTGAGGDERFYLKCTTSTSGKTALKTASTQALLFLQRFSKPPCAHPGTFQVAASKPKRIKALRLHVSMFEGDETCLQTVNFESSHLWCENGRFWKITTEPAKGKGEPDTNRIACICNIRSYIQAT